MPFITPPRTRRDGDLEWAWHSEPHAEHLVSGDALFLEEGREDGVLFLLLDVMGHGEEAAFVVELFRRYYLGDEATHNQQPQELLNALSSLVAPAYVGAANFVASVRGRRATEDRFICALAVLIDPATRLAGLAAAGLPTPYLLDEDGAEARPLPLYGMPLGIAPLPAESGEIEPFGVMRIVLGPTCRLVAMTDGILESRPATPLAQPLALDYEKAMLPGFLRSLVATASATDQVTQLFLSVQAYTGTGWPRDDSTSLLWQFRSVAENERQRPEKIPFPPLLSGGNCAPGG